MPNPVLILGASGGVGSAIARRLVADGYPVILHGRNRGRLESLASSLGPAASIVTGDLSDESQTEAMFAVVRSATDRLSGVVFSVATQFRNMLTRRVPWKVFEDHMSTQVKALHLSASLAFPLLADTAETTRLVVVGTEAVLSAPPIKTAPYTVAKAALTAYAQVIAREWLKHNVRVHIVAPGMIRTELTAFMPEEYLAEKESQMPEGRLTSAEDVAAVVSFQMTAAADTLYGAPLRVSRGERT